MSEYKAEPFSALRGCVSDETLDTISNMGFTNMTEIQAKCIPILLEGGDLSVTAKTGSGKTLAFLIPAIERLKKLNFTQSQGTGVIIISPRRELSIQTFSVLKELLQDRELTHGLVIGGTKVNAETKHLRKGVNILVATPGRLLEHLQDTKHFIYNKLNILVIDEADLILDIGFEIVMTKILKILPKLRQTMLFSATKGAKVKKLVSLALKPTVTDIDVDENKDEATTTGLTQNYALCPADKRFLLLYSFIKRNRKRKTIVFFSSCNACKFYAELFNYIDIPAKSLHGRQNQNKRTATFNDFKNGEIKILLCTDVAARGWDIPDVDWIIQYDPPSDPKEYIHRVGRTARAGGQGNALLILTEVEMGFVQYLKSLRVNVDSIDIVWSKVADIQIQVEKLVSENDMLHMRAEKAYKSYIRSYSSHSLKACFDVKKLDDKKIAKCFGLAVPPFVDPINHKFRSNRHVAKRKPK